MLEKACSLFSTSSGESGVTLRSSADTITQRDEGEQLGELVEMFVLQKVRKIALDSCVS